MAGMLPGVETARRRRIHGHQHANYGSLIGSSHNPTRYSASSIFYAAPINPCASSSLENEGIDERLGQMAREAKKRLDRRLRPQTKSNFRRNNSDVSEARKSDKKHIEIKTQVYGSFELMTMKKKIIKGLSSSEEQQEQEDDDCGSCCAVCLDEYIGGENVVKLPCKHSFHSRCMLPWLPINPLCPCCRSSILP